MRSRRGLVRGNAERSGRLDGTRCRTRGNGSGEARLDERKSTGTEPSARYGHAMAYDPARGLIVLVGGADSDTGSSSSTWAKTPWRRLGLGSDRGPWTQRLTGSGAQLAAGACTPRWSLTLHKRGSIWWQVGWQDSTYSALASAELWQLDPARDFSNPAAAAAERTERALSSCHGLLSSHRQNLRFRRSGQQGPDAQRPVGVDGKAWLEINSECNHLAGRTPRSHDPSANLSYCSVAQTTSL